MFQPAATLLGRTGLPRSARAVVGYFAAGLFHEVDREASVLAKSESKCWGKSGKDFSEQGLGLGTLRKMDNNGVVHGVVACPADNRTR